MKFNAIALSFAMLLCGSLVAEDAPAKKNKKRGQGRNNAAASIMKQFADIELTDEQKTKIQEMAKKSMAEVKKAREDAGITAEIMKKRNEAMKELKESGKKQSEIFAAVNEKVGITEAQAEVLKKSNEMRAALLKGAVALLTDEQKAKLPQRLARAGKQRDAKAKGKGKKKKEAKSDS